MDRLFIHGVHLGVEIRGNSAHRPLVVLHGFTGSAAGWGSHLDTLASYGVYVIALDMLGHGLSDAPSDPKRYAIEHCREDIIAALRMLGVDKGQAILLGYSMGGRIALYTALSGFFHALILESASPGLATPAEREQRRASDEQLAARIEREGIAAFVTFWEQLPLFATQLHLPAEQRLALRQQRLANRASGLANSLRGVGTGAQPSLYAKLPQLTIPTLLLAGELDPKYCTIARAMSQLLPDAHLEIVPNAGHTIHLEQPTTFDQLLHIFLQNANGSEGFSRTKS